MNFKFYDQQLSRSIKQHEKSKSTLKQHCSKCTRSKLSACQLHGNTHTRRDTQRVLSVLYLRGHRSQDVGVCGQRLQKFRKSVCESKGRTTTGS